MAPWPCAVHMRPIRVVTGVDGVALTEEDGFLMTAVGGLMPVGLGKRDDAVDALLVIDLSDGVGDGALAAASGDGSGFVSLIFFSINFFTIIRNSICSFLSLFFVHKIIYITFHGYLIIPKIKNKSL